jgi:DNA-binding NarL/FixJ family response regulator
VRRRIGLFISIVQSVLILAHLFVYKTWTEFHPGLGARELLRLRVATLLLSFTFIAASLLAWRSSALLVRLFYTLAAVWLGFLNLFFMAAFACWIAFALLLAVRLPVTEPQVADALFGIAVVAGIYDLINASWTRVHRVTVKLPNLPDAWRGRVAALVSDTHLGHVRNAGFLRRIVRLLRQAQPDIVFVTGDIFDGTMVDAEKTAHPWKEIAAPLGAYFVTGNHEEFTGHEKFVHALQGAGLRELDNRKIEIDGLQIVARLHASKPRLPIIMMTAHGTTETAIEATKLGAFEYLVKPFEAEELLDLTKTLFIVANKENYGLSDHCLLLYFQDK